MPCQRIFCSGIIGGCQFSCHFGGYLAEKKKPRYHLGIGAPVLFTLDLLFLFHVQLILVRIKEFVLKEGETLVWYDF